MSDDGVDANEMFQDEPTLESFARDLRHAAADVPAPVVGAVLAAILDGAAAPARSDVAVPSARRVARGRLLPDLSPRGRLRLVLAGSVLAGGLVALAAAGGSLPAPAQRNVARLADVVGIDLPDGDDAPELETEGDPPTPSATTTPTSAPPPVLNTTSSTVGPAIVTDEVADDQVTDELDDGGADGNAGHGDDDDGEDGDNPGAGEGPPATLERPTPTTERPDDDEDDRDSGSTDADAVDEEDEELDIDSSAPSAVENEDGGDSSGPGGGQLGRGDRTSDD